jgi:hypothetical protein
MRSKKKSTFHQHAKVGTAGETVLLSAAISRATSYARMRTTVKHHAAGTVKRTVPYKGFCIFFINWEMATDIKLKDYILYKYKEKLKKKGLIILYLLEWLYSPCGPSPLFQFPDLFYSQSTGLLERVIS